MPLFPYLYERKVKSMVDSVNEKITKAVMKTILKHYPKSASMNMVKGRIQEFKETIKKLSDPGISPERKDRKSVV